MTEGLTWVLAMEQKLVDSCDKRSINVHMSDVFKAESKGDCCMSVRLEMSGCVVLHGLGLTLFTVVGVQFCKFQPHEIWRRLTVKEIDWLH